MPAGPPAGGFPGAAGGATSAGRSGPDAARHAAGSGPPPFLPSGAAGAGPPARSGPPTAPSRPPDRPRRRLLLVGGAAIAILLAGGAVAWALTSGDDPDTDPIGRQTTEPTASTGQPSAGPPPDEQCTDEILSNERWVCLTSATLADGQLVVDYQAEWAGGVPDISTSFHLHVYGGDGTTPPAGIMGSQAGDDRGEWVIKDDQPTVLTAEEVARVIGDAPKVCARIADSNHALVPDASGGYATGNCIPIQR
jgi:hypothetical protein